MKKLVVSLIAALILLSLHRLPSEMPTGTGDCRHLNLVYLCKIDKMIAAPLWRSVKKSFDAG